MQVFEAGGGEEAGFVGCVAYREGWRGVLDEAEAAESSKIREEVLDGAEGGELEVYEA